MSPVTREERRCRTCAHDTDECDPHHCGLDGRDWAPAAATGGEQGPSSDELEIARLRRELTEIAGAFRQSEQYREEAHSQLAVIVDEAFGLQEVLPLPNLLSRLERLLTERARQHEEELDKLGADRHDALSRRRAAAQILIAEIGASGPEDVEETSRRAVRRIEGLRHELSEASAERRHQVRTETDLRRERDEAIAKFELIDNHRRADSELISRLEFEIAKLRDELDLERGQKRADLLQGLAEVTVALRDLIDSVTATKTRDAIVLRDIDAARAVLGGQS